MEMNRQDLIKIKQSLKDPNFHNLLEDYMLEISDPKNKKEYDDYLLQLEKEGDLPKDMTLIKPEGLFCLQSKIASEMDKKFTQKIFINICIHKEVQEASYNTVDKGNNWKLPYSVGKLRYSQEDEEGKKSTIISIVDIVFNPNITGYCLMSKEFKKMIFDVSVNGVDTLLNQKKEKVDKDYRFLEGIKSMGGEPAITPIKKRIEESDTGDLNNKPKLYHDIMNQKDQFEKDKKEVGEAEETKELPEPVEELTHCVTPFYKLVYIYKTDSDDFIESKFKESKKAVKLKLHIELPRVSKTSLLQCDIENNIFSLKYEEIYYLNIDIPVKIDEEEYQAKFDKKKKTLNLEFKIIIEKDVEELESMEEEEVETGDCKTQEKEAVDDESELEVEKVEEPITAEEKAETTPNIPIKAENKEEEPTTVKTTANNTLKKICIFNQQTIEETLYIMLNFKYHKDNLVLLRNDYKIFIVYQNQNTALTFKSKIISVEYKEAVDFITFLIKTENNCFEFEETHVSEIDKLDKFIEENDFKELENLPKEKPIDQTNENTDTKENQIETLPTQEDLSGEEKQINDFNFLDLHLNQEAFKIV